MVALVFRAANQPPSAVLAALLGMRISRFFLGKHACVGSKPVKGVAAHTAVDRDYVFFTTSNSPTPDDAEAHAGTLFDNLVQIDREIDAWMDKVKECIALANFLAHTLRQSNKSYDDVDTEQLQSLTSMVTKKLVDWGLIGPDKNFSLREISNTEEILETLLNTDDPDELSRLGALLEEKLSSPEPHVNDHGVHLLGVEATREAFALIAQSLEKKSRSEFIQFVITSTLPELRKIHRTRVLFDWVDGLDPELRGFLTETRLDIMDKDCPSGINELRNILVCI